VNGSAVKQGVCGLGLGMQNYTTYQIEIVRSNTFCLNIYQWRTVHERVRKEEIERKESCREEEWIESDEKKVGGLLLSGSVEETPKLEV